LRVAAIVMPTSEMAMQNIDDMATAAEDKIEVRYFSSVENARQWLTASPR
jgi:hypothetical protein